MYDMATRQRAVALYQSGMSLSEVSRATGISRGAIRSWSLPRVTGEGHVMLTSYSRHWPCLFPQHGPGKKHERAIVLEPWQRDILANHPWDVVRGLFHSDGSRVTNWTTATVSGKTKRYEYPRYFLTNKSADIVRIYCDALDLVGISWKVAAKRDGALHVSIARRESVALMDAHVGAKF
ncbi:helix-turn-helix domain-containing protein [Allostreptomyces psammosilenae]|uniref:Uncharacterized protein n=1 Tax=Allostreptomyces psammosilenae TaxID=1892865 RepID=A0A852ZXT7_9ACTN|nr:helix-turn-helix domain-containing protein [Allostreptomyces psammosilenae]NYI07156.1 hypothetical protein [Allostreptomyces psammosilenae]